MLVCLTSWIGVAWHRTPWAIIGQDVWRGSSTLTYANATGAIAALLVVAALSDTSVPPGVRRLLAGMGFLGLASTLSRGACIALLVAIVATVLSLSGTNRRTYVADLITAVTAAATAAVLSSVSFPANIRLDGSRPDARPWPAVGGIALGVALILAVSLVQGRSGTRHRRLGALVIIGAGLAAVAVGFTHVNLVHDAAELLGPSRWTLASEDRSHEWAAAWSEFRRSPIVGVGPGRTAFTWNDGGQAFRARFAHNELLEILATLGLTGVIALAIAAGWARHTFRTLSSATPWQRAARRAVVAVVTVQALVDFTLHLMIVPLVSIMILITVPSGHLTVPEDDGIGTPSPNGTANIGATRRRRT